MASLIHVNKIFSKKQNNIFRNKDRDKLCIQCIHRVLLSILKHLHCRNLLIQTQRENFHILN